MTREELIEVMARAIEPRCWEMMDEVMARAIEPRCWEVMDAELNRMLQKYKGQEVAYPSDQFQHKESMATARKALAAIEAAGVRLVPVEATHKMADVGTEARWQSAVRDANNVREIWRAMLAASPYTPQKETK